MSEVLEDVLSGSLSSQDIISWITQPVKSEQEAVKEYPCTKQQFISYYLLWLRRHVKRTSKYVPPEKIKVKTTQGRAGGTTPGRAGGTTPGRGGSGTTPNRCNTTPGRGKRVDRRKTQSPGQTPPRGQFTPRRTFSATKYQTPFKDSLSSLSDYPPLGSSTPVEELSRRDMTGVVLKDPAIRKVDFSSSFKDLSSFSEPVRRKTSCSRVLTTEGIKMIESNGFGAPDSPPLVRRTICSGVKLPTNELQQNFKDAVTDTKPIIKPRRVAMSETPIDVSSNSPVSFNDTSSVFAKTTYSSDVQLSFGNFDQEDSKCLGNSGDMSKDSLFDNCFVLSSEKINTPIRIINTKRVALKPVLGVPIVATKQIIQPEQSSPFLVQDVSNNNEAKSALKTEPSVSTPFQVEEICENSKIIEKVDASRVDVVTPQKNMPVTSNVVTPNNRIIVTPTDKKTPKDRIIITPTDKKTLKDRIIVTPTDKKTPKEQVRSSKKKKIKRVPFLTISNTAQPNEIKLKSPLLETKPLPGAVLEAKPPQSADDKPIFEIQPRRNSDSFVLNKSEVCVNIPNNPFTNAPFSNHGNHTVDIITKEQVETGDKIISVDSNLDSVGETSGAGDGFQDLSASEIVKKEGTSEHNVQKEGTESNLEKEGTESNLKIVYCLAEIYSTLLNYHYICNPATELYLLFNMCSAPSGTISVLSEHVQCFVIHVINSVEPWLKSLDPGVISLLRSQCSTSLVIPPSPGPLFSTSVSIGSVAFQQEEDSRPQFPNDRVFHVFKRIRDTFHSLLRDWEEGHSSHGWNSESVLGERMKSLVGQKLQLAIFSHFSKLFISLLLKRYKLDLCNNMDLPGMTREEDKLKKLQNRLAQPSTIASEGSLCAPSTFPLSQEFFKTFIVCSQNYSLNKHLSDHISSKIVNLNNKTKSWFLGSIDLDNSDMLEDFSWNMLTLQLLAKFLGLLAFMPYYTGQKIPASVAAVLKESRNDPLPLDIYTILCDSVREGTLILCVPWICELLAMMDSVAVTLHKPKQCLIMLNSIYTQLHTLGLASQNAALLVYKLGWIMELLIHPHGLFSIENNASLAYEPTLDSIPVTTTPLLYACCPWLRILRQALNPHTEHTESSLQLKLVPASPSRPPTSSLDLVQAQLRENFFHNQPHTVRRVCEFMSDRLHNNSILTLQSALSSALTTTLRQDIINWIDRQDSKELLNNSFKSRLHFQLGSLVASFTDSQRVWCEGVIGGFCEEKVRLMSELLPPHTESCVVSIAMRLTVEKAVKKSMMWVSTTSMGFVEKLVQEVADNYVKHLLTEIVPREIIMLKDLDNNLQNMCKECSLQHSTEYSLQDCDVEFVNEIVQSEATCTALQSVGNCTVELLKRHILHRSDNDSVFIRLCSILNRKKGVVLPLHELASEEFVTMVTGSSDNDLHERYVHVIVRLIYEGVLGPARVENWLMWHSKVQSSCREHSLQHCVTCKDQSDNSAEMNCLKSMIRTIISDYELQKSQVLKGETMAPPGVACFLRQYFVEDFSKIKVDVLK